MIIVLLKKGSIKLYSVDFCSNEPSADLNKWTLGTYSTFNEALIRAQLFSDGVANSDAGDYPMTYTNLLDNTGKIIGCKLLHEGHLVATVEVSHIMTIKALAAKLKQLPMIITKIKVKLLLWRTYAVAFAKFIKDTFSK